MNEREKLYDLKNRRKTLLDEAKALVMEGKHESDEYKGKLAEVDNLNGQIKALEDLMEQDEQVNKGLGGQEKGMKGVAAGIKGTGSEENGHGYEEAVKAFASAARAGFPTSKAAGSTMNEGTNDDGGYTVPEDIVTRIERFRDSKPSLRSLVSVEPVTTNKGRRTHKKRSQQTGFAKVSEGGKIPAKSTPLFSVISYIIQKFAGFFPVTSELLEDSDENITSVLVEWIGDEARVTENKNILTTILKKAAVDITGLDGLKKAVLVDLNAAFRATAKIITNANGLYWLSTLKDQNGRDLLTPIPSEKGKMQLACGPVVVPVEDLPNDTLPNDGNKVPFMNHIGLCVAVEPGYVTTIDGNTGTTNEANGGAVMRRRRSLKYVGGAARPVYEKEEEGGMKLYKYVKELPYGQDAVTKAINQGYITQNEDGSMGLWEANIQTIILMDRAGLLDKPAIKGR